MTIPIASPARVVVPAGMAPSTPPPPTYAGHFSIVKAQTDDNPANQKRMLWEYCLQVLDFLLNEIQPRLISKLGYTNAEAQRRTKDMSDAHTALTFSLGGGYSPNRDYSEAFDYVQGGGADEFLDLAIRLHDPDPIPMPNPRANPQDFEDWAHFNPLPTYGARRHRKTRRRTVRRRTHKRQQRGRKNRYHTS